MSNNKLTKKQKNLVEELSKIFSTLAIDYENIEDYKKRNRTSILELAKDKIIRGQILFSYVMIDEYLSNEIIVYLFGLSKTFPELWKTKKFRNFHHFVIEELSLLQKLKFVNEIIKIPKNIKGDIRNLNSLRNGIAHSLFPEKRRIYKPLWKGKSVLAFEGLELFDQDMQKIHEFFHKRQTRWKKGS